MAVALGTVGGFLLWIGIRDVPIVTGLREILKGKIPTPREKTPTSLPSSLAPNPGDRVPQGDFGAQIVAKARTHIGDPYVWGGHSPGGFDCSGLITYVLARELGMTNLPSPVHTVTLAFLQWGGAVTVPREQIRPGDLVCWFSHIGIASGNGKMIHAPTFGQNVTEAPIHSFGTAVIRRVKSPGGDQWDAAPAQSLR